jgi:hypothetical protein
MVSSKQIQDAIASTLGAANAGKLIKTDSSGYLDYSLVKGTNGFFQLGSGGPGLRANGSIVEARNSLNTQLEEFRCSILRVGSLTNLYGSSAGLLVTDQNGINRLDVDCRSIILETTKLTISNTEPSSPSLGDLWYELESSGGQPKYGWPWFRQSSYWLSPRMSLTQTFRSAAAFFAADFPTDPNLDYYISEFRLTSWTSVNQTSTNRWESKLIRLGNNVTTTATDLSSAFSTNGDLANIYTRRATTINTHVDVSAAPTIGLTMRLEPFGTPGNISGSVETIFQYARP